MNFNTLHIYKDRESILYVKEGIDYNVDKASLTTLPAFVNSIKALTPKNKTEKEFLILHVFNNIEVLFLADEPIVSPKEINSFKVNWDNVDLLKLQDLINEIENSI